MNMTVSELEEALRLWRAATPQRRREALEMLREAANRQAAEVRRKIEKPNAHKEAAK